MTAYKTNTNHLPNELYKPDWEELHDFHAERRDRLTKEAKEEPHELFDSKLSRERRDQIEADNDICLTCLDTYQHQTIGDYLDWLEKNFMVPTHFSGLKKFNNFKSLQDAKDKIDDLRLQDHIKREALEEKQRLLRQKNRAKKELSPSNSVENHIQKNRVPDIPSVANNNWPLWERVKDAASALLGRG